MPVPTLVSELSTTAGSNSPSGSDSPTVADDHFRAGYSFIAQHRDGSGFTQESTIASAATTDIGASTSFYVQITGTTTITSFGVAYNGPRFLRFTGILTLTHNATTLILPGGANITTAAGDTCIVVPSGNAASGWRVVSYERAALAPGTATNVSGTVAVANGGTGATTASGARTNLGLVIGTDVLAPNGSGASLTGVGMRVNQILSSVSGAANSTANTIAWDDTIPQSSEGLEFYSLAITPASATSTLVIQVDMQLTSSSTAQLIAALFKDSETDARAANVTNCIAGAGQPSPVSFTYSMTSGSTSSMTFKVRAGASAGSLTLNGSSGARKLGGVHVSGIRITEYLPA